MSYKDGLSASPFLISKSIMRYALRTQVPKGYTQLKQKNIHLFINKKHTELSTRLGRNGESTKEKAVRYLMNKMEDKEEIEKDLAKGVKVDLDKELDAMSKKILEEYENQKPRDYIYIESQKSQDIKKKKAPSLTKEQRLREIVHNNIPFNHLSKLFEEYKKKQFDYEAKKQKEQKNANVEALMKIKANKLEAIDDYFVVQTMNQDLIDLKQVFDCPGIVLISISNPLDVETRQLEAKEPVNEVEHELEQIIETQGTEETDDCIPQKERKHWVDIHKLGELASLAKPDQPNVHFHRLNAFYEAAGNPYDYFHEIQEERRKREMQGSADTKRFVRKKEGMEYQMTRRSMSAAIKASKKMRFEKRETENRLTKLYSSNKDFLTPRESSLFNGSNVFVTARYRSVSPTEEIPEQNVEETEADNPNQLPIRSVSVPKLFNLRGISSVEASPAKRNSLKISSPLISTRPSTAHRTGGFTSRVTSINKGSRYESPAITPRMSYDNSYDSPELRSKKNKDSRTRMLVTKRLELEKQEVREAYNKFYKTHEGVFTSAVEETKEISKSISKEKIILKKKYDAIDRVNNSALKVLKNPEHTTNFQNLIHFKKKLVTKLVDSITNKEEVLVSVQRKKTLDAMAAALQTQNTKDNDIYPF